MTAVEAPVAPDRAARPSRSAGIPTAPAASVAGGAFKTMDGLLAVLRGLRAARATEDIVGFAIPLEADPTTAEGLETILAAHRRRGFNPIEWLLDVIDPHRPPPSPAALMAGYNSILTPFLLGDLSRWLVGVKTFRIPLEQAPGGGVWVLGRPNHAAAIAGATGAALGGAAGALASLGLPADQLEAFAERIAAGQPVLTVCSTDEGRIEQAVRLMRKQGAEGIFIARGLRPEPRGQA
jgi:hypothetical protein